MNVQNCYFYRWLLFCIVIFGVGGATITQGQQQDTNNAIPFIAEVNQLKDKVKTQEDIILRANSRISELERQLAEQTKQNNRLQLLCEKAGIKIPAEPDGNSSPNQLKDQIMEPNKIVDVNNHAEKIEMARIKIQKMSDAIELVKTHLHNLPSTPHTVIGQEDVTKALENATKTCRLYHNLEWNYINIIQLAKIYPELGINAMAMERTLTLYQRDTQDAESEKKYWQERSRIRHGSKEERELFLNLNSQ